MSFKDYAPWNWKGRRRGVGAPEFENNPFSLLQRQMNGLMEDFMSGLGWEPDGEFTPKIDLSEDGDSIRVRAELPGMEEKDIEVSLTKEALTIRGEKRSESESSREKDRYSRECSYGFFQRVIPLTAEVNEDKVDATFKRGVLEVVLYKTPASKSNAKKIPIRQ